MTAARHSRRQGPAYFPSVTMMGLRYVSPVIVAQFASDIGLSIQLPADDLERVTRRINHAVNSFALAKAARNTMAPPAEVKAWADDLRGLARKTITLLGGATGVAVPDPDARGDAGMLQAARHLDRAWPHSRNELQTTITLERLLRRGRLAFPMSPFVLARWRGQKKRLRLRIRISRPKNTFRGQGARQLVAQTAELLAALAMLADRIAIDPLAKPSADTATADLFVKLGQAFKALHGAAFSVTNNSHTGVAEGKPIEWVLALLERVATTLTEELGKHPRSSRFHSADLNVAHEHLNLRDLNQSVPSHPLIDLYTWAKQHRDGLADRIKHAQRQLSTCSAVDTI